MTQKNQLFRAEFHDVGLANFTQVAEFLPILQDSGWPRWDLMVVPDATDVSVQIRADFQRQLQQWRTQGHVLHVHGFRHRTDGDLPRSCSGQWVQALTSREAEFAGLNADDSRALLEKAQLAWDALEVGTADGFVAPTWHGNPFLKQQCQKIGWRFFGSRWFVHDFSDASRRFSPAFSFAGMPLWSLSLMRFLVRSYSLLGKAVPLPMARLVLHPGDLAPETRNTTLALLRFLSR